MKGLSAAFEDTAVIDVLYMQHGQRSTISCANFMHQQTESHLRSHGFTELVETCNRHKAFLLGAGCGRQDAIKEVRNLAKHGSQDSSVREPEQAAQPLPDVGSNQPEAWPASICRLLLHLHSAQHFLRHSSDNAYRSFQYWVWTWAGKTGTHATHTSLPWPKTNIGAICTNTSQGGSNEALMPQSLSMLHEDGRWQATCWKRHLWGPQNFQPLPNDRECNSCISFLCKL